MNMIERVARAIAASQGSKSYVSYVIEARAAIEAMMEPTDEMVEASAINDMSQVYSAIADNYKAMIAEALK